MIQKMPISRDVRVNNSGNAEHQTSDIERNDDTLSNRVTVMGLNKNDVLFHSDHVGCVQWRDSDGDIIALLIRIQKEVWGFSKRGDKDWPEMLELYGNKDN